MPSLLGSRCGLVEKPRMPPSLSASPIRSAALYRAKQPCSRSMLSSEVRASAASSCHSPPRASSTAYSIAPIMAQYSPQVTVLSPSEASSGSINPYHMARSYSSSGISPFITADGVGSAVVRTGLSVGAVGPPACPQADRDRKTENASSIAASFFIVSH